MNPLQHAFDAVRSRWPHEPDLGLILGSGLGAVADAIAEPVVVPYAEVPGFARSTAIGHAGRLICGWLGGKPVVAMQGRFHLYEGWPIEKVVLPVRLMHRLGAGTLVVTNAAGGVNPRYRVGDLMLIDDQINLKFRNPLVGENDESIGPRFPDMSAPYDKALIAAALRAAMTAGIPLQQGVYAGMLGPTYETRAEYRMVRQLGADAVGMSTVPEVIAAVHAGMRVLGLSVITNACSPDDLGETTGEQVADAAAAAAERVRAVILGVIATR
ncbi:Purine nucleoside phosphorylase 1 [Pirellulimonas nuda]|uniref:Purine nucleoside phosphorylase n=1 Tax=Pirellulimonas nuda TaxID=2528009 RepID=A0A518DEP4_9BACT|nr:purine-nucleoside phosphorylase [Pirellulimonas nuda]QDU89950.1 Purine nucleoside phosphorylase 1 [Pirellulimonas nuda]